MKLTDALKNKLGNAKTVEEVKDILAETKQNVEDAGVVLEDSELDLVAGGEVHSQLCSFAGVVMSPKQNDTFTGFVTSHISHIK